MCCPRYLLHTVVRDTYSCFYNRMSSTSYYASITTCVHLAHNSNPTLCSLSLQAGGKVRGIKKGVPEALRPDGDGTDSTGSSGDGGGLSGAAVAAIVVVVLIVAVLVAMAVAGAVLVWFRKNRQSFMIVTGGSATSDPSGDGGRGGKSGRVFPMRAGSDTYVPVPATAMAAKRGEVDDQARGKCEDEATERDPLEEGLKITHL